MRSTLHFGANAVWAETGFMVKRTPHSVAWLGDTPLMPLDFGCLNPEVNFRMCFTRWELVKIAVWFAWQATRRLTRTAQEG